MTKLYIYDINKNLKKVYFEKYNISQELIKYKLLYEYTPVIDISSYPKFELKHIISYNLSDYHIHNIIKTRVIVKGGGIYYFKVKDEVLMLDLEAGDGITIPSQVQHKFISFGQTTILKG